MLSDLSSTVLLLLGITGVGSAAAKGTDVRRNRINFDNWSWFVRKGWLPPKGVVEVNRASWNDIFTSDGEFDVYRYQSCLFSLAVGGALLVAGITELASFEIPQTLLGILGLRPAYITEFLATRDGLTLVRAFTQIKSPKLRRLIVDLVEQVSE